MDFKNSLLATIFLYYIYHTTIVDGLTDAKQLKSDLNRLLVFTVATDTNNQGFVRFNKSVAAYDLDLIVLGSNQEWRGGNVLRTTGGGQKINLLKRALSSYKSETDLIVLFVDSYDVIINGDSNRILSRFNLFEAKVVFSAESNCWPDASLQSLYPMPDNGGERYLNSGGFMGHVSEIFDLLNVRDLRDDDDDQLYFSKLYVDKDTRAKFHMKLDHKSELFQNLNEAQNNVRLQFFNEDVSLLNTAYLTEPLIVHGNGPSKNTLNSLGNYLGRAWSPKTGCTRCNESMISLSGLKDTEKPIVLLAVFIEQPTPFIEDFFTTIENLNYPKKRIHLLTYNSVDYHNKDMSEFQRINSDKYLSVRNIAHNVGEQRLTEWQARTIGLEECKKVNCDYYFCLDSLARIDNVDTLTILIESNRTIIAPMLVRPRKLWSNFWGALTEDNFYARSHDYVSLIKSERKGIWNVPHLMNAYLINGKALQNDLDESNASSPATSSQSEQAVDNGKTLPSAAAAAAIHRPKFSYHSKNDPDLESVVVFSRNLRNAGVFQYVTNMHNFGHLVDPTTYNINRTHPDFYQLANNMIDWERHYLHENYTNVNEDGYEMDEPCPDVYWFPLVSDKYCKQMIEIMENFGQWSEGKNEDTRIEGGYESVPTRDIHMKQVDLQDQWLLFLREYVQPVQLKLYIGYEHDPPRAELAFVVRYNPAEQPSLRPHHDASTYTLNLALNTPNLDYEGGGCRFLRYNCSVVESKRGWTLIHPGRLTHYHEGLPVTKGTRYIQVTFVDNYIADWLNPWVDEFLAFITIEARLCSRHPWISKGGKYDTNSYGLSCEIEDFCIQYRRIRKKKLVARMKMLHDFCGSIKQLWPQIKIGLNNCNKELDIFWTYSDIYINENWDLWPPSKILKNHFNKDGSNTESPTHCYTPNTEVKILDMHEDRCWPELVVLSNIKDKVQADMSELVIEFHLEEESKHLSLKRKRLIFYYSQVFPELPRLFYILSESLITHDLLCDRNGGLSPYALILMIVAYLNDVKRDDKSNIGDKLIGFLDTFGLEENSRCIRSSSRSTDASVVSFDNASMSEKNTTPMSIYDPLQPDLNLTQWAHDYTRIKNMFNVMSYDLKRSIYNTDDDEHNQCCHSRSNLNILFSTQNNNNRTSTSGEKAINLRPRLVVSNKRQDNHSVETLPTIETTKTAENAATVATASSPPRPSKPKISAYARAKGIMINFGYLFLVFMVRNIVVNVIDRWNDRAIENAKDDLAVLSRAMMGNDPLHGTTVSEAHSKPISKEREEREMNLDDVLSAIYVETLKRQLRGMEQEFHLNYDDIDDDPDDDEEELENLNMDSLFGGIEDSSEW